MNKKQDDKKHEQIETEKEEIVIRQSWKQLFQLKYLVWLGYGLLG